jgi:hypothetical protein
MNKLCIYRRRKRRKYNIKEELLMTVEQLKKALDGLDNNAVVVVYDYEHGEIEIDAEKKEDRYLSKINGVSEILVPGEKMVVIT